MTEQPGVRRVADMRLRSPEGWLPLRIHWPVGRKDPGVLVDLTGGVDDARCRELCARTGSVVLSVTGPVSGDEALAVLSWAADHAAELDADPARLTITGPHAESVAGAARNDGIEADVMM